MIVTIRAPKAGVGSSTVAVLLARARSASRKVLLVDASLSPSLDIYTDTAHLVPPAYAGNLHDAAVSPRGRSDLRVLRIEPGDASLWSALQTEMQALHDTDVILDFGDTRKEILPDLSFADLTIVVLTQDNQILRAADRLFGELRNSGNEVSFIVNMLEEEDAAKLGGLEEIFDLIEEDHLGSLGYCHGLRFAANTGFQTAVPEQILDKAEFLCGRIFGEERTEPVHSVEEKTPEGTEEVKDGENVPPRSVLEGIRSFFRGFRKG